MFAFDITEFRKHCLLNGLDEIGLTLAHAEKIKAFEAQRRLSALAVCLRSNAMSLPATQTELDAIPRRMPDHGENRAFVSAGAATIPIPGRRCAGGHGGVVDHAADHQRAVWPVAAGSDQLDPEMRKFALAAAGSIGSKLIGKMITSNWWHWYSRNLAYVLFPCRWCGLCHCWGRQWPLA